MKNEKTNLNNEQVKFEQRGRYFDGASYHFLSGLNIYSNKDSKNINIVPVDLNKTDLQFQLQIPISEISRIYNALYKINLRRDPQ